MLRNGGQEKRDYHKIKGFNSRLDEIQAAILRVKLKHLEDWNNQRRKNVIMYDELLTNHLITKPKEASYAKHIYHLYVVRCSKRDLLRKYLAKNNIETQIHYPVPIHLQKAYEDLRLKEGSYSVAEQYANEILSLPMYPELTDAEIGYVAGIINSYKI